ncbi:hypothetical protein [Hydrotalea sp. AMD]|uniref:hypothetical protein n=1 Tax=Hydrotalea sp. AMD TaxID=2501297 RepID=UPI002581063E|nr:hypothetical protein [Hydrotalea sp. AMD]
MSESIQSATAAHRAALTIFTVITNPTAVHVINYLQREKEGTIREMETDEMNISRIRKAVSNLIDIGVVRRESVGTNVYYKLIYEKLGRINSAAARIL